MQAFIFFALAVTTLLFTPGPTNTLLAASGAAVGLRRSLHLLIAEAAGYLTVALVLGTLAISWLHERAELTRWMQIAAAIYLVVLAVRLWRYPMAEGGSPVSFGQMWLTTLLNPKAAIVALVLLPPLGSQRGFGFLFLASMIPIAGAVWIIVGTSTRRLAGGRILRFVPRVASIALFGFASALAGVSLLNS